LAFLPIENRRSWDKLWIVLLGTAMSAYKDQKSCRAAPDSHYHGEPPLDVTGGAAEVANDYTKKKNVFRLKCVAIFFSLVHYSFEFA
jgi:hypothetical protein